MRILFIIFLLIMAVLLGLYLQQQALPVSVIYQDLSIEIPLWLAILAPLAVVIGLLLIFTLFANLYFSIKLWWHKIIYNKLRQSGKFLQQAVIALVEGDFFNAEKQALRAVSKSADNALLAYLVAAQAVYRRQDWRRCDDYLSRAAQLGPSAKIAANISRANWRLADNNLTAALTTVDELQQTATNHPQLLMLQVELYLKQVDLAKLCALLPNFNKYCLAKAMPGALELARRAYQQVLIDSAASQGRQALIAAWQTIPNKMRGDLPLLITYVKSLIKVAAHNEAEGIVRKALKKPLPSSQDAQYDQLVELYGLIYSNKLAAQITFAENLLRSDVNNSELLLALARLCIRHKLWGKAKSYLQNSIAIKPTPASYVELAKLTDFLGDSQQGKEYYKHGLLAVTQPQQSGKEIDETSARFNDEVGDKN